MAFAAADERLGGGHGLSTATAYLSQTAAPILRGSFTDDHARCEVFGVAAELAYLVGFKHHDLGQEGAAQRYYLVGYRIACETGNDAHPAWMMRVLLLRRGAGPKFAPGLWDLPVGKNQDGEPVTTTAVRELREETGLLVDPSDLHAVHVIPAARGVEAPHGFLTVVFATHHWTGTLVNAEPHKHDSIVWTPVDAIPDEFVPTTHAALTGYLRGDRRITLDGWATSNTHSAGA
jgi:8-oxo-dGTP pyrophosphatase MutT (NUDIX family)